MVWSLGARVYCSRRQNVPLRAPGYGEKNVFGLRTSVEIERCEEMMSVKAHLGRALLADHVDQLACSDVKEVETVSPCVGHGNYASPCGQW